MARKPTPEERERIRKGPRYRPERPRPSWDRRDREVPTPESIARREAISPKITEYLGYAYDFALDYMRRGIWTEDEALRTLMQIRQEVYDKGIQPSGYAYEAIIRFGETQVSLEHYENIKPNVLATNWSYDEKLGALLGVHPQGYDPRIVRQIKADIWATLSPEEQKARVQKVETRKRETEALRFPARQTYVEAEVPEPMDWLTPFEQVRAGLGGPQPWKEWFERSFSTLVRRYKGTVEGPATKTWAEYLKSQKAKLREEWWGRGAYARGERPSAFAPRIRTAVF